MIINDHKCFQYAVTLALNYDKIDKNHQRISKIALLHTNQDII